MRQTLNNPAFLRIFFYMEIKRTIALTGFMGSGKSSIGRDLARETGTPFHDLDEVIEQRENLPVPEIFRIHGEDHFRMLEHRHLRSLLEHKPCVIALGGGAFQQADIRRLLSEHAVTLYLKVPLETLFQRLQKDKKRPLLRDADGTLPGGDPLRKRIAGLLAQREPCYQKADITVDVGPGWTSTQTLQKILRLFETYAPDSIAAHN